MAVSICRAIGPAGANSLFFSFFEAELFRRLHGLLRSARDGMCVTGGCFLFAPPVVVVGEITNRRHAKADENRICIDILFSLPSDWTYSHFVKPSAPELVSAAFEPFTWFSCESVSPIFYGGQN